jgi:hypothetical protein
MRFFLWVLVILGIAASAGAIGFAAASVDPDSALTLVPLALSAALWLLWVVFTLILLLLITSLLRRLWINVRGLFGELPAARLLSLGIVAVVFSATVYSVLRPFIFLLTDLAVTVPDKLQSNWHGLIESCQQGNSTYALADCTRGLLLNFTAALTGGFSRAVQALAQVRWTWLFFAIALWAALGQLLSEAIRPAGTAAAGRNPSWAGIVARVREVRSATWINTLLFVLIGFGGLLSISALIAIPVLSDAKPMTEQDLARQGQRLDAIVRKAELEKEIAPDLTESDELKAVWESIENEIKRIRIELDARNAAAAAALAQANAAANANPPPANPVVTTGVQMAPEVVQREVQVMSGDLVYLESYNKRMRESVPRLWRDFRSDFFSDLDSARQDAFAALQRQSFAPGGVNGAYVGEVETWLREAVNNARSYAVNCRERAEFGLRTYADSLKFQLAQIGGQALFNYSIPAESGSSRFVERCALYPYRREPNSGELTLGAFAFSAWLIKLNSMPLTLIAGMLGFGLMGAAGSSVIRERGERLPGAPLVKDLPSVVVRGLSATVVVFLAVKSGLLIFTGGTSGQADPHVLLLTCLIASVFSEDVWDAMKKWIARKMRDVEGGGSGPGAGGGAGAGVPGANLPGAGGAAVPAGAAVPGGATAGAAAGLSPMAPQGAAVVAPTVVSSKARASSELKPSMPLGPGL